MLPDPADIEPIAAVVRARREELGLSQGDLADAVCLLDRPTVTGNDIARWERGKRIPRAGARRALEEALHLPTLWLDQAAAAQRASRNPALAIGISRSTAGGSSTAVDQIRAALLDSGVSALWSDPGDERPLSVGELDASLDQVMNAYQSGRFDDMLSQLPSVLSGAHQAVAGSNSRDRCRAHQTLALSGQATAMVLTKLGEHDLAWIAAERGLAAAQEADDEAVLGSLKRSVVHTLQSHGRTEASTRLAERTADDLRANLSTSSDRATSVYGTLLLAGSMAAARSGDQSAANEYLDEAEHHANQLGHDANHLWTAFGRTNVAVHRVATAVAQDDIASAEQHAATIDESALPSERRIRYLFDLAMIAVQRNKPEDAITTVVQAEHLAPEQVHNHVMAQQIVGHLRSTKAGRQDPRLAQLDRRTRRTKATTSQK